MPETPQQFVLTAPFFIGEEVYDDLAGKNHKVIGIQYELGHCDPDHPNISSVGCWGIWIDSKHLDGGRHPWEVTKFSEILPHGG